MKKEILKICDLNLNFRVKKHLIYALRGINLSLGEGEILGLVGESGSGKSVISKALMGLLPDNALIQKGSILYKDLDLAQMKDKQFNKIRGNKISIIFQNPLSSLNPLIKVGKQIYESLQLKKTKSTHQQRKNQVLKLMEEVGIPEPMKRFNQYPHQLSGGMCQRIVIAIALANEAKILICDESTTALDVSVQKKILDLIKKLQKEKKLSIIFITHDLEVVKYVADRIAVIYAGRIVEYGTTHEVFYNSKHPYTWALLQSMPVFAKKGNKLKSIQGNPHLLTAPILGDAFAPRNPYALKIDFEKEPPMFKISATHYASSWLLHKFAPRIEVPDLILELQKKGGCCN
ncbi:ABC-type dipeptide/oligopeptide transport system, ATPase component [Onion yellows phytoplasma OY-M]|uniref:ABC-type dipeptide/oligopeptide transport system, ATPase component n=1 Tax=Onion yellows phytoplasma (strain OY-M) TaxID=262768 RepID=Q6YRI9_ONYPE|nr:ABC-type dipeptide/oligopeptide transport system, ATPase component [Onion yellows phytoplasma OY-M]